MILGSVDLNHCDFARNHQANSNHGNPREAFIFRGYNPYIGGSKPSFFMVLGSKGINYLEFLVECRCL